MSSKETALLFGGCFWGIQDLVRRLPSVNSTRVGYSDVANAYATHRNHGTHGEALEVVFGPARTSWRALLEFFFLIHNPSTPNRQGNDGGCYYRSGIYYKTPEHRQITGDDCRRRRLGPVAGQDGHWSGARRPLLAGRAGAQGLFAT